MPYDDITAQLALHRQLILDNTAILCGDGCRIATYTTGTGTFKDKFISTARLCQPYHIKCALENPYIVHASGGDVGDIRRVCEANAMYELKNEVEVQLALQRNAVFIHKGQGI